MNNVLLPTPEDLTLDQICKHFDTDEKAVEYLEAIRWKDGKCCPHCGNKNQGRMWKIQANKEKKIRIGLHQCAECKKQFTVTVGTIFEDTHIPIRKWLIAWYMMCSSKKGISSLQLQRQLDIGSYRTALFMTHRIRHALKAPVFEDKLSGTVEVDETYIGGRVKGKGRAYKGNKTPVVSLVERGGRVRSQVMPKVTGKNLKEVVKENVAKNSIINTDELKGYRGLNKDYTHNTVNHSKKEYVRGEAYTNTAEGYFSLLKRGVNGTFHHVSRKHLHLYLAEFDHRYNYRDLADGEITIKGLQKIEGKRLTYKQPIKS